MQSHPLTFQEELWYFPPELWAEIFKFTDARTMLNISFIHPYFSELIKNNILHIAIENKSIGSWSLYIKPELRNIHIDYKQLIYIAKAEHINYHTAKFNMIHPHYQYDNVVELPTYLLDTIYITFDILTKECELTHTLPLCYLYNMLGWYKSQLVALWYAFDRKLDIKQLFKIIDMYTNIEALYIIQLLQHNITDIDILCNVYKYNDDDIDKLIYK